MNVRMVAVSVVSAIFLLGCRPGPNATREVRCAYASNEVCGYFKMSSTQQECRRKVFSECMEIKK